MNDGVSRDEAEFDAEVAEVVTDLGHEVFQIDTRMAFKLVQSAQDHWHNAPHLVALVRAGARFEHGVLAERPEAAAA